MRGLVAVFVFVTILYVVSATQYDKKHHHAKKHHILVKKHHQKKHHGYDHVCTICSDQCYEGCLMTYEYDHPPTDSPQDQSDQKRRSHAKKSHAKRDGDGDGAPPVTDPTDPQPDPIYTTIPGDTDPNICCQCYCPDQDGDGTDNPGTDNPPDVQSSPAKKHGRKHL